MSMIHFEGDTVTVLGNIKYNTLLDTFEIDQVQGLWAGSPYEFLKTIKDSANTLTFSS